MATESRRIAEIYVDTQNCREVDSQNNVPGANNKLTFWRKTQTIVRCHLRLADGSTYFEPPASTQWTFAIDNVYTVDSSDLVVSENAVFNVAADWDDIDATGGKISWRVDTSTDALKTAIGATATLADARCELWMTPPGVASTLMCQWRDDDVIVRNIVTEIGADTTLTYYSNAIVEQVGQTQVVLYYADGSVAATFNKEA